MWENIIDGAKDIAEGIANGTPIIDIVDDAVNGTEIDPELYKRYKRQKENEEFFNKVEDRSSSGFYKGESGNVSNNLTGNGVANNSEKTAIAELSEAVTLLTGSLVDNNFTYQGNSENTYMAFASTYAKEIEEKFHGVNGSIENAWASVAIFCDRIVNVKNDLVQSFVEQIRRFAEEVNYNEESILRATTTANEAADQILSRMHSSVFETAAHEVK